VFGQDVEGGFPAEDLPAQSEGQQCAAPQYAEALTLVQASATYEQALPGKVRDGVRVRRGQMESPD